MNGSKIQTLLDACHMLHEQAHGDATAFRVCPEEPCRIIARLFEVPVGPAQLSLMGTD